MAVRTKEELLAHELKDMYFAEKQLVKALAGLEKEALDGGLRRALGNHRRETINHALRLERVFGAMGRKPAAQTCPGILGLIKEKKDFAKERPTKEILQAFNLTAAMKAERYEITAYESMIRMADALGYGNGPGSELQRNLDEELAALETLQGFASRL